MFEGFPLVLEWSLMFFDVFFNVLIDRFFLLGLIGLLIGVLCVCLFFFIGGVYKGSNAMFIFLEFYI